MNTEVDDILKNINLEIILIYAQINYPFFDFWL